MPDQSVTVPTGANTATVQVLDATGADITGSCSIAACDDAERDSIYRHEAGRHRDGHLRCDKQPGQHAGSRHADDTDHRAGFDDRDVWYSHPPGCCSLQSAKKIIKFLR